MNWRILIAQLWELWRLTRVELVPRLLAPVIYLWLFTWLPDGVLDFTKGIHFLFILAASMLSTQITGGSVIRPGFARPVPTARLRIRRRGSRSSARISGSTRPRRGVRVRRSKPMSASRWTGVRSSAS